MKAVVIAAVALLGLSLAGAASDDGDYAAIIWAMHRVLGPPSLRLTCLGKYMEDDVVEHPAHCYKYQNCVHGRLLEMECPAGTYFEESTRSCDTDIDNVCPNSWRSREVDANVTTTIAPDCGATTSPPGAPDCGCTTSPPDESETTTIATMNVCQSANVTNGFIADPLNCTNFYQCADSEPLLITCPEGKFYNADLEICQIDFYGQCLNPCANATNTISLPTPQCDYFYWCQNQTTVVMNCTVGIYSVTDGECNVNGICITDLCVNQPDYTTFPVIGLPTFFYVCVDQLPVVRECDPGDAYSTSLGVCMTTNARAVDCNQNTCQLISYAGNAFQKRSGNPDGFCICRNGVAYEQPCPADSTFDTSSERCISTAACDPDYCDDKPDYNVTRNRYDDNSFCMCVSHTALQLKCPFGGVFNQYTGKCHKSSLCDHTYCLDKADGAVFAAPEDNMGFCLCMSRLATYMPCSNGTIFNPRTAICTSTTGNGRACDAGMCTNSAKVAHPAGSDTENFCYCTSLTTVVKRACPADTHFDTALSICLSKHKAKSTKEIDCDLKACGQAREGRTYAIAARDTTKNFCYCLAADKMISLYCPIGKRFNERLGVCSAEQDMLLAPLNSGVAMWNAAGDATANTCPGGYRQGDLIKHQTDCQRFYICYGGELHQSDCGVGNYFDERTRTCNWDRMGACRSSAVSGCMDIYSEGDSVPHSSKPQLYFICYNQILQPQDCGPNNVFDVRQSTCVSAVGHRDFRGLARSNVVGGSIGSGAGEKDFHCNNTEKHSVPSNCSQYETCRENVWHRETCSDQRYYNPEQQRCMEPRDDNVCAFARVTGLPLLCNNETEQRTLPAKSARCGNYFRCVQGKWTLKPCPKGRYYAQQLNACIETKRKTEVCVTPNVAATVAAETQSPVTVVSKSKHCQHTAVRGYAPNCGLYLMCLDGLWWQQYCALGMYFNRTLNTCLPLDGSEASCGFVAAVSLNQTANAAGNCSVPLDAHGNCPDSGQATTAVTAVVLCTRGAKRVFALNCTAYEECGEAGDWRRASCAAGLAFDDGLHECVANEGNNAFCGTNGLRRICTQGDSRPLGGNQTRFYYCEDDTWRAGECLVNHTYVAAMASCAPPNGIVNATLSAASTTAPPTTVAAINFSTSAELTRPLESMAPLNSSTAENVCANATHGARLPHALYCNLHYTCVRGLSMLVQCPAAEQQFDVALQRCSAPNGTLQCPLGELPSLNETAIALDICRNQSADALLPHPGNCTRYYRCMAATNGSVSLALHCSAGEYYDAAERRCMADDGVCPFAVRPAPMLSCDNKHGVLLPDASNCNDFHVCLNGRARHESCYADHYFNATAQQCQRLVATNHTEQDKNANNHTATCADRRRNATEMCAQLANGANLAVPGDCRLYTSCQPLAGAEPLSQRCRNGENYDNLLGFCRQTDGTCLLENGQRIGECNERHGQLVANAKNCRGYFVCLNGQKIELNCEASEFFDAKQLRCVNDELKQCKPSSTEKRIGLALSCAGLDEAKLHANVADECRSYYSCIGGTPHLSNCAHDLRFDERTGVCVEARLAAC